MKGNYPSRIENELHSKPLEDNLHMSNWPKSSCESFNHSLPWFYGEMDHLHVLGQDERHLVAHMQITTTNVCDRVTDHEPGVYL